MKQQLCISILAAGMSCGMLAAADYPQVRLANGKVTAIVAVPNAQSGFYKGTRFDWSGIITSLETNGHLYFAPFFEKFDPGIKDVDFTGTVLAGPASAVSGPVEEFAPLGYDDTKAGGTFVKIGVGVLRKPEEQRYDHYEMYTIVDGGKRSVKKSKTEVSLTQEVRDPASGYGYLYTKTVRLVPGQSRLELVHSLKNVGEKRIAGNVYDHNFFVIDHQPIGPDIALKFGFTPKLGGGGRGRGPAPAVPVAPKIEARGNEIDYVQALGNGDTASSMIQGYGATSADYDFRVENRKAGAGAHITGDHPLSRMMLWSIRTTTCPEAYIDLSIEPGQEMQWKYTYEFYPLDSSK
jgi:hypothetical protein